MKFAKCKAWLLKQGYREEFITVDKDDGQAYIFTADYHYFASESVPTIDFKGKIYVGSGLFEHVNTQAEVIELWEKLGEKE